MRARIGERSRRGGIARGVAVAALLQLCACTTMNVHAERDRDVDFSGLRTYTWVEGKQERMGGLGLDSDMIDRLIRDTVDRQMGTNGYRKAASAPDMLLGYRVATREKTARDTMARSRSAPVVTGYAYTYEVGSLILEVSDPASGEVIWHGSAEAELDRYAPDGERQERVANAVRLILERLPSN